jgi:hypothetical protein
MRSSYFGDLSIEEWNGGVFQLRNLQSTEAIRVIHLWRTRGSDRGATGSLDTEISKDQWSVPLGSRSPEGIETIQ